MKVNFSNFLYGDDNQPQIMSTTPCSESTVSANELTEDSSYNNSSSFLPADNSLIGNTSCNGYILPSTSLSTFSTAPPSIDGKPTSEPCTSQLYFYPTPTFHFEVIILRFSCYKAEFSAIEMIYCETMSFLTLILCQLYFS